MQPPTERPGADPAVDLARRFLEAAVYASRDLSVGTGQGACGLGDGPVVPVQWSTQQVEAITGLVPGGLSVEQREAAEREAAAWIRLQDGLDRKRNHFLKAFRQEHGFDRKAYSPEVRAKYQTGLDAVNQDNDERLATAAQRLLDALGHAHRRTGLG